MPDQRGGPGAGFAPAPGRIDHLRLPGGPGVRVDTHLEAGLDVPPHYDSLLAKLVVWDVDRPAAIERALRALRELEVGGVPTTREAALEILDSPTFRSGRVPHGLPCRDRAGGGVTMSDDHTITRDKGTVTLTAGVLSHVVVAAARPSTARASGVRGEDCEVDVVDGTARVELELAVRYGDVLPVVAEEVQRRSGPRSATCARSRRPRSTCPSRSWTDEPSAQVSRRQARRTALVLLPSGT